VEYSATLWPVPVEATGFEETIALLEKEVVIDKLLLIICIHAIKRVKFTRKITSKALAGLNDMLHNLITLILSDTWAKREVCKISSDSNSS